jgi:hypothetical protein
MTTQFSSSDPEIQEAAAVTGTFPLTATAAVSGDAWYGSFRRQLVLADTLIVGAAVGASAVLTFGDSPESLVSGTPVPYPLAIFLIGAIWLLCLSAKESRDRHVVGAGLMEYERVFNASLWAFGAIAVLSYLAGADLSRMLFVATLPLGVTLLALGRWALRARLKRKRRNGAAMTPTLIVGTPRDVERLRLDMNRRRDAGYLVVAVCEYDGNNPVQPDGTHGLPHVPLSNVGTYVRSSGIGAVAVCGALPTLELREARLEPRGLAGPADVHPEAHGRCRSADQRQRRTRPGSRARGPSPVHRLAPCAQAGPRSRAVGGALVLSSPRHGSSRRGHQTR